MQEAAQIAVDLGAEESSVSLLRWSHGKPCIQTVHRFANSPAHRFHSLHWPLDSLLAGVEEGLRKAAGAAPEGVASIGVDGWSVDYVRLAPNGSPLRDPFCYRDERTTAAKKAADLLVPPFDLYRRTGALPSRNNTVYQLLADRAAGIDPHAPWVTIPEFVLQWLGGRRVAEYTGATHTGLADVKTGGWDQELFRLLDIPLDAAPPIVPSGTILGRLRGPLAALDAFRETVLIAPACLDTASAIAGIPASLGSVAYIDCGAWSTVGTLTAEPAVTREAFDARLTNLGAAGGGYCLNTLVSGNWILKQCVDAWRLDGRPCDMAELIAQAAGCGFPGVIDLDAEPLLFDSGMPERINHELWVRRLVTIPDVAGNEPVFARIVLECLAKRYASALASVERTLDRKLARIHILGGGGNWLLAELVSQRTGRPVEVGRADSSTIGNFAVQLAAAESDGAPLSHESIRRWAQALCET